MLEEMESFTAEGDVDNSQRVIDSCQKKVDRWVSSFRDDWEIVEIKHQSTQLAISALYVLFVITVTVRMYDKDEPEEDGEE